MLLASLCLRAEIIASGFCGAATDVHGFEVGQNLTWQLAADGTISVYGAKGQTVSVYDTQGACLYRAAGSDITTITVHVSGIYIVQVGNRTTKLAVPL